MAEMIEFKSEFIPIPPSLFYENLMILLLIGVIREKGQSSKQAEFYMTEYFSVVRGFGLPAPTGKQGELAKQFTMNIENYLNDAMFKTKEGKEFTINLFDGFIKSKEGNQYKVKGVFSEEAREYIFNNRELSNENYEPFPTVIRNEKETGTILTARIPKDKLEKVMETI